MKVTHYHRKPWGSNFSIERLFSQVRESMPMGIECERHESRFISSGLFKRVYNILEAPFYQGDINHITGDIHYVSFFLKRKKTILTIHDCASLNRLKGVRKMIFYLFWFLIPEKRVSVITVISNSTKRELLKFLKIDPNKVFVVHDCVSKSFVPVPKRFNSFKPTILQIGTGENKNFFNALKALKDISCHFRIVGKLGPEQEDALISNNIEYSNVHSISDSEMLNEYSNCDFLLFASTYEGFGMPIIEANATGRAVVTSNIFSMPEVAGRSACIVDPFSVSDIRRGILKVINDEGFRDHLISQGFKNVLRFNSDFIAEKYVNIYNYVKGGGN